MTRPDESSRKHIPWTERVGLYDVVGPLLAVGVIALVLWAIFMAKGGTT